MPNPRIVIAGASLLAIAGLIALASYFRHMPSRPIDDSTAEGRLRQLKEPVEQQEYESKQAVVSYFPKTTARLDDIAAPVAEALRQLPGVSNVEIAVRVEKLTHRIIHLRDWQFVHRDLFAIDVWTASKRPFSEEEIDRLYEELLLEVQSVQLEQLALLRCLIKHHGLRPIFSEGLTEEDLPSFKEKIAVLRAIEQEEIPQLRKQLHETRELKKGMEAVGRDQTKSYEQALGIEHQLVALLQDHQKSLLELGSPRRLLIANEIEAVLPLEDPGQLIAARPMTPAGKMKVDPQNLLASQDSIVKAATRHGSLALIVLGGTHDLSDSVRQVGDGQWEYIRVTTRRYQEFSGEKE
jgi:hypothetical protein